MAKSKVSGSAQDGGTTVYPTGSWVKTKLKGEAVRESEHKRPSHTEDWKQTKQGAALPLQVQLGDFPEASSSQSF